MRLLIDMNLTPRWVETLRARGFDAVHWSSIGALDAPDTEIMERARRGGRVVVTQDLDFGTILAASQGDGPSVVQLRADDTSPEAVADAVVRALRLLEAELDTGALVTIDTDRARVRLLPLTCR